MHKEYFYHLKTYIRGVYSLYKNLWVGGSYIALDRTCYTRILHGGPRGHTRTCHLFNMPMVDKMPTEESKGHTNMRTPEKF